MDKLLNALKNAGFDAERHSVDYYNGSCFNGIRIVYMAGDKKRYVNYEGFPPFDYSNDDVNRVIQLIGETIQKHKEAANG